MGLARRRAGRLGAEAAPRPDARRLKLPPHRPVRCLETQHSCNPDTPLFLLIIPVLHKFGINEKIKACNPAE